MHVYIWDTHTRPLSTTEPLDGCSPCAHMCFGFLSDPSWGGSKVGQEGVKESFKDKKLFFLFSFNWFIQLYTHSTKSQSTPGQDKLIT